MSKYHGINDTTVSHTHLRFKRSDFWYLKPSMSPHLELNVMAETVDGKKDEADYKRLHSFPLIRVKTVVEWIYIFDDLIVLSSDSGYDFFWRLSNTIHQKSL